MTFQAPSFGSSLRVFLLALTFSLAESQSVETFTKSDKYAYIGCYNETTDLANSSHARALADGIHEVLGGQMTVPTCLEFCSSGHTAYRYAGLEYSRECWCSQHISGLSSKVDDSNCNTPCDGAKQFLCGGSLKLSVYELKSTAPREAVVRSLSGLIFALGTAVALTYK